MHESDREPASLTRRELLASAVAGTLTTAALGSGEAHAQFEPPAITKELWQWVRVQPVSDVRDAWFDTASVGATLRLSMASEYRAREIQSNELPTFASGDRWSSESLRLAGRFARFCGCELDEVLFTRGAGEGISLVAAGVDLNAGDEVLTTTQEHPAALSPWLTLARRRGIVVKQVQLPALPATPQILFDAMAAGFSERTRVLAINHVQYADGTVMPVRELSFLARAKNVLSVVNGSQALGMFVFQLRELGCDFYASGFQKWLGGSHGSGLLFARREAQARLWPVEPRGFDSAPPIVTPTRSVGFDNVPGALRRFGNVVPSLWPALRGSEAALDFHEQVNRARIEARMRELVLYTRMRMPQVPGIEILTPSAPGMWGGILTFRMPGRFARDVVGALANNNRVYFSALNWPATADAMRLSISIFNSHDDIDRFITGLQNLPKL